MMEWDKVMKYEADVVELASKLSHRIDPSMKEDAIQHTLLVMHTKVDVSKAVGDEKEYVRGAIWNIVQRFFRDERKHNHVSLETLSATGAQVTDNNYVVWGKNPSSGNYQETDEQEKE